MSPASHASPAAPEKVRPGKVRPAIIADSVISLPENLLAELKIHIVPILLRTGSRQVREEELSKEELLSVDVKTSAPSPGSYMEAIQEAQKESDQILIFTASKNLSASYSSACLAAKEAQKTNKELNIQVIDTKNASSGQGIVTLATARAIGTMEMEGLKNRAEQIADQVRLIGAIPNLDHLVKIGRIPSAAGWANSRLGLRLLFEIRKGEIKRMLPARNLRTARQRIIKACLESKPPKSSPSGPHEPSGAEAASHRDGRKLYTGIVHTGSRAKAEEWESELSGMADLAECFIAEFSQSLAAVAGEDVIGMAWWWE